jgi:hypothetical protein
LGSEEDGHGGKVFTAMMLWGSEAVVKCSIDVFELVVNV